MSRIPAGIDFLLGLVAGAVVGATASIMLAPYSGRETLDQLADFGESTSAAVRTGSGALRSQITSVVQTQLDLLNEAVAAAREARDRTEQVLYDEYERSIAEAKQAD